MSDKKMYHKARKDDALMYIAALIVIVGGLLIFPMFSIGSAIPAMTALVWGVGVFRFNKKTEEHLLSIEPQVQNMIESGMSEHDAMKALGCDKYYYKPFWAIR
ncbi:hypothetical protein HB762_26650 (plasmid) [Vibrio campbellii]|uniref:Uncharacterized protein n=1 Tax=Vibrio campbellii TaxID=680 RepID=A0ABY5INN1_9VIBR|nr:hypothetical protein [Vibrio campbellii]UTZ34843.1 hypothetical protein HB762_26650 [Vibrio campbellii]